jgi:hypothetical protein
VCGLHEFGRCPACLQLTEPPDPGCELAFLNLSSETGELEMGMCIYQAGEDDCFTKILGWHIRRSWDVGVSSNSVDPAARAYE